MEKTRIEAPTHISDPISKNSPQDLLENSISENLSLQRHVRKDASAVLVLFDGSFYLGKNFGANQKSIGELVFTTAMTGYQESLTDPSYAGQILAFSYPLQGNYGINSEDLESAKVQVSGVVASEICENPSFSHYKALGSYSDYLRSFDVPCIANVDTRAIVRKVRNHGAMPAAISPIDPDFTDKKLLDEILSIHSKINKFNYGGINFVDLVCEKKRKIYSPGKIVKRVALLDCGVKLNIIRELNLRGCEVTSFPYNAPATEISKENFDGLLISNGPGDPALMSKTIENARTLMRKFPTFGICLGHQIIAHALGGTTYKLKFGHRGGNHAVLNPQTGKTYVTAQNHGYSAKDVPKTAATDLFINCNDKTNEGLSHTELPIISSQFHPEGSCGPKDANFLFDEFLKMMK